MFVGKEIENDAFQLVKFLKKNRIFNIYADLIACGITTIKDFKSEMSTEKEKLLKSLFKRRDFTVLQINSLKRIMLRSGQWLDQLQATQDQGKTQNSKDNKNTSSNLVCWKV